MVKFFNKTKISIMTADITKVKADAIVNAANSTLMGGGGVDGAIHKAGGISILEECKKIIEKIGSLPAGEAVVTNAGRLDAGFVIHTVGPVWHGGTKNEPAILHNAYFNSLKAGAEKKIKTIAFPAISTGVYGYPKNEASLIAIKTVKDFLLNNIHSYEEVMFVLFNKDDETLYEKNIINF